MKHTEKWVIDDGMVRMSNQASILIDDIGTERQWVAIGIEDEDGFAEVVALAHPINARLIASAPDLLEEHKHWAKIQGRIIVEALQGEFEYLKVIAQTARIEYINGEPYLKSEAINKSEGK